MSSDERTPNEVGATGEAGFGRKAVTRRDFLKTAGVAGAALGIAGGAGSVLTACGGGTTTSSSSGATGRTIKIGFVSPKTGPLAPFGEADAWCVKQWEAYVTGRSTRSSSSSRIRNRAPTVRARWPASSSPTTAST